MKVLIQTKLSAHKYKTPEGYLVCQDAILARTGAQEYYKSEIYETFEGEDEPILVYRNPEEVFAPATLASFEDKPITVEHPDQSVTPENYSTLAVGHTRNVRKGRFNDQDVMIADLIITDAEAIKDIEAGVRTDLSCGYDCDITDGDNPQQINIRGNHVALCEQGRAGIAKIIDSKSVKVDDIKFEGYTYNTDNNGRLKVSKEHYEKVKNQFFSQFDDIDSPKKFNDLYKLYVTKYHEEPDSAAYLISLVKDLYMKNDPESKFYLISGKERVAVSDAKQTEKQYITDKSIDDDYKGFIITNADEHGVVRVIKNDKEFAKVDTVREAYKWIDRYLAPKKVHTYTVVYLNSVGKATETKVKATSEYEARKKVQNKFGDEAKRVLDCFIDEDETDVDIDDSNKMTKDTAALPSVDKSKISNYLSSISKFTKADTDIFDVIDPLKEMGYDLVREHIDGWRQIADGRYRKDYFFKIDGYKDIFMISFYTEPDGQWKVDEINAYFTGKPGKSDAKPLKTNFNKYVIFKQNGAFKGTTYNNFYRYGNSEKFDDYSTFDSVEELTEYLMDNKNIKRENIIYVKDSFTYKKPASINKAKLKELNKQLKAVNNDKVKDDDKQEMIAHQKRKIKEKILAQIKKTEAEIEENAEKGLDTNISNWYNENFDEVSMNDEITFNDLFDTLDNKESVYELLGVDDFSIIKRCLTKLAELINAPYDYVYEQWNSYEE